MNYNYLKLPEINNGKINYNQLQPFNLVIIK